MTKLQVYNKCVLFVTVCNILFHLFVITSTLYFVGVRLYLQQLESTKEYEVANFTVLHAGLFRNSQGNIFWCQSANNNTPIGDWYFPNGSQVMTTNSNFHVLPLEGQIGLLRNTGIGAAVGLYRCVVPDENNVDQTLWAGIYSNGAYDDVNGKCSIMLHNTITIIIIKFFYRTEFHD